MASIKDVAALAMVSIATVSRVLNQNPRVKPAQRERVLTAMRELDYHPSGIARNMRNQSIQSIALIISDIQNPFFTSLVRAVEDVAMEKHYSVLLCNSDESIQKEQEYLNVLIGERVAGVIVASTCLERIESPIYTKMPVVLLDRKVPGLKTDTVVLDNIQGAYLATRHLIQCGHRSIGFVGAPPIASVGLERRLGYEKALNEAGIPIDGRLIQCGDFKPRSGYAAARSFMKFTPRPTALFVANNLMTQGVLEAIQEEKLRIPHDFSVVGFDDMSWYPLLNPPLTSVRQPTYQLGQEAAQILIRRIQGDMTDFPKSVVLQPELVVRSSVLQIHASLGTNGKRNVVPEG